MKTFQLVNSQLTRAEIESCERLSRQYVISDCDLVADLFRLFKTKGTRRLSRTAVTRLIRSVRMRDKVDITAAVEHRFDFLLTIHNIPLFDVLVKLTDTHSVEEALDRLLNLLRAAYKKHKESYCGSCPLLQKCGYGPYVIAKVKNNITQGTPHVDCPLYGTSGKTAVADLTQGAQFLTDLLHPAFTGVTQPTPALLKAMMTALLRYGDGTGCGKNDQFDSTFTGQNAMTELQMVVDRLTKRDLALFQVARTFDKSIAKDSKGKLIKSPAPDADKRPKRMEAINQLPQATAASLALPHVLRNYNIATKQIVIVENQKPESKKPLMYVLLDCSGSMAYPVSPNRFAYLTKGDMASALVLACIKKTIQENSMIYLRFFAGRTDMLFKGETLDDFAHMSRKIAQCDFNGGATNITGALATAFSDIQKGQDKISKSEVVLISDGEDNLDEQQVRTAKKQTKLHTLQIKPRANHRSDNKGAQQLRTFSDTYIDVDPDTVDLEKVATVV